jgi:hypothetical protein
MNPLEELKARIQEEQIRLFKRSHDENDSGLACEFELIAFEMEKWIMDIMKMLPKEGSEGK